MSFKWLPDRVWALICVAGLWFPTASAWASPAAASGAAETGSTLTIEVLDLASDTGTVIVALFGSEHDFEESENPVRQRKVKVENKAARIEFNELAPGDYALRLIHDRNDNGKVDTNWAGIPSEPFGFSNDAMGTFGPPSFEQAKFELTQDPLTVRVTLKEF